MTTIFTTIWIAIISGVDTKREHIKPKSLEKNTLDICVLILYICCLWWLHLFGADNIMSGNNETLKVMGNLIGVQPQYFTNTSTLEAISWKLKQFQNPAIHFELTWYLRILAPEGYHMLERPPEFSSYDSLKEIVGEYISSYYLVFNDSFGRLNVKICNNNVSILMNINSHHICITLDGALNMVFLYTWMQFHEYLSHNETIVA